MYQFNINSDFEIGHAGSMAMETPWIIFSTPFQLIWYNSKRIWAEEGLAKRLLNSVTVIIQSLPVSLIQRMGEMNRRQGQGYGRKAWEGNRQHLQALIHRKTKAILGTIIPSF